MTIDHETSERVYRGLKVDVLAGRSSGRLQISDLTERFSASATPVREALLRLVGEGLVEMRASGGFAVTVMSEEKARDLYQVNLRLMLMAVGWPGKAMSPSDGPPSESIVVPPVDLLFLGLAQGTGNAAFFELVGSMNDRLCILRQAERVELAFVDREFINLDASIRTDERDRIRRALQTYHRRRLEKAGAIVRELIGLEAQLSQK